jgi:probable phosphoglycerate mutase
VSRCPVFDGPFLFLRHGETETNRLGLTAGMTDVVLNETGRRQAMEAAAALAGRGVEAIYSSPLQRALVTAQCVARMLELPIITIAGLAERNWGVHEGQPRETRCRAGTPEGGEGLEAFTRRTLAGLATIPAGRLPLIVAHSGTFRVLCAELGIAVTEQVQNCRPMRFDPPGPDAVQWRVAGL